MSYCNRFGLKQKHGHFGSVLFVHYSNDIGLRLTVRTATLPLETCWGDFHEIVSDRRCDTRLSGARSRVRLDQESPEPKRVRFPAISLPSFKCTFEFPAFHVSIFSKDFHFTRRTNDDIGPCGEYRAGPQVASIFHARSLRQQLPYRLTPRLGS